MLMIGIRVSYHAEQWLIVVNDRTVFPTVAVNNTKAMQSGFYEVPCSFYLALWTHI